MTDTGHFRGEGSVIWEMDLPLPEAQQEKLVSGRLRRVNPDGSEWSDNPTDEDPPGDDIPDPPTDTAPPKTSAPKGEWVGYAVAAGGMAPDDAEALTKHDLIDRFGGS